MGEPTIWLESNLSCWSFRKVPMTFGMQPNWLPLKYKLSMLEFLGTSYSSISVKRLAWTFNICNAGIWSKQLSLFNLLKDRSNSRTFVLCCLPNDSIEVMFKRWASMPYSSDLPCCHSRRTPSSVSGFSAMNQDVREYWSGVPVGCTASWNFRMV